MQHLPQERDGERSTTQKKEKGEDMQHPLQRKEGKGNHHFIFTYLILLQLVLLNLS